MASETILKTTRFEMLTIGSEFTSDAINADGMIFIKASARKAIMKGNTVEFNVKPSTLVQTADIDAMVRRDAEEAKPVFDGTEASCKNIKDFYALNHAKREVELATEAVDKMADYLAEKMASIKLSLSRNATRQETTNRFQPRFSVTPAQAVEYAGLNSCGEVQGNGNIDMCIATLLARREAFAALIYALGYRVK